MNHVRILPKQGQVYSLEYILKTLYLRDSPSLNVSGIGVIQTSHLDNGDEDLLSIPGFKDTKWKDLRETSEWIPLFRSEDTPENIELVKSGIEYEPWTTCPMRYPEDPELNWVTPKGYPRPQED